MADTIEEPRNPVTAASLNEKDADRLGDFGYEQELRRDWGLMHNFGISFSIIVSIPHTNFSIMCTDVV